MSRILALLGRLVAALGLSRQPTPAPVSAASEITRTPTHAPRSRRAGAPGRTGDKLARKAFEGKL